MTDDRPAALPGGEGAKEFDAAAWVGEPDNRPNDEFMVARAKVAFWMFVLMTCGLAIYVTARLALRIVELLYQA
ncbi:hypothetical protein [Aminobacter ciceronei]|jgi:hypothetical protein|uniref:hypothetical protein n=1 Tax=Aminobacter ciceronei TaxID=150723 RepID=UPI003F6EA439